MINSTPRVDFNFRRFGGFKLSAEADLNYDYVNRVGTAVIVVMKKRDFAAVDLSTL